MRLLHCYIIGTEACLFQQDTRTNGLRCTIYFDADRLQREILQTPEDSMACKILEDLDASAVPNLSNQNPVSFCDWSAANLMILLASSKDMQKNDVWRARNASWVIRAMENDAQGVPDQDSDAKLLLFVKTPESTYYVFLVYSQRQSAQVLCGIGASLPEELIGELLRLPVDSTRVLASFSGLVAQRLVTETFRTFDDMQEVVSPDVLFS